MTEHELNFINFLKLVAS